MTIHHATMKKAADNGITLTEAENGEGLLVEIATKSGKTEYETEGPAKDTLAAALAVKMLIVEYPGISVIDGWLGVTDDSAEGLELTTATADDIDAWFAGLDDDQRTLAQAGETDEEEREGGGSVVPAIYKQRYAERGDPNHCGDWMAVTLNRYVHVIDAESKKKVTDYDRLEAIAIANGVTAERPRKLTTVTPGWQGRYRMTVRNMLAPLVAAKGFMLIPEGVTPEDVEEQAPAEWVAAHAKPEKPVSETKAKTPAKKQVAKAK